MKNLRDTLTCSGGALVGYGLVTQHWDATKAGAVMAAVGLALSLVLAFRG